MALFLEILAAIAPPILIGLLFWFIMRAIIRADSKERQVYAEIEAEERAKIEAQKPSKNSSLR
jgi:flagellar biosynthesis/type III secretory pathway M-ring protein FliF/YscJ